PGGEGGNGSMGLAIFSNNVMIGTWSAIFPNFNQYADFHHWKAYPNFVQVQLQAGLQVIKLQSKAKHLQLDYVQFDLAGAGTTGTAGTGGGAAGTGGGAAGTGGGASGTGGGAAGAGGTTGAAGTSGGAGTTGAAGTNGASGTGGNASGAAGDGATAGT